MKEKNQKFTISKEAGTRLDVFLAKKCKIARSQVQKWMKYGVVSVNGEEPKKHGMILKDEYIVELNFDEFEVEVKPELTDDDESLLDDVKVLYETKDVMVIEKPRGLITHPVEMLKKKKDVLHTVSVSAWALRHNIKMWGVGEYKNRPGVVHRLDKETSGVMLLAKTQKMFDHLKNQFKDRTIQKKYIALTHGDIEKTEFALDFDIAMGKDGKMASRPKVKQVNLKNVKSLQPGKNALTECKVIERFVGYTLVEARPKTGRTHQIRVHLYAHNNPIVGDPLYYNKKVQHRRDKEFKRLFLHAAEISFTDLEGVVQTFSSPLPEELEAFKADLTLPSN